MNMRITKIVEEYKILFLIIFLTMSVFLLFSGIGLFDSVIISGIFSTFSTFIKYLIDKLFKNVQRKINKD